MKFFVVIISVMGLLFGQSVGSHNRPHNVTQTSALRSRAVFEIRTPLVWSSGYPLSQGIKVGNTVYLSGQLSKNSSGVLVGDTVEEQAKQVFENIKFILEAVRGQLADIVKLNIYLQDLNEISAINEVMEQYFNPPYPSRTTIGAFLSKGFLVEIDAIAYIDRNPFNALFPIFV